MPGLDANTKLLLHGNDPILNQAPRDACQEIVDSSHASHIVYQYATAGLIPNNHKFGRSSAYLPATANSFLSIPSPNSDFDWGTGDWTVSFWHYKIDTQTTTNFYSYGSDVNNRIILYIDSTHHLSVYAVVGGSIVGYFVATSATPLLIGAWQFISFARNGSNCKVTLDGVDVPMTENNAFGTLPASESTLYIGESNIGSTFEVVGYLDDFKIDKGEYINYIGAVPTEAATNGANTVLRLPFDEDCEDKSASAHTVILKGSALAPVSKFGSSVLALDGDSDYLTINGSTAINPLASYNPTYVMSCWLNIKSLNTSNFLLSGANIDNRLSAGVNITGSTGKMSIFGYLSYVPSFSKTGTFDFRTVLNQWVHFTMVRSGTYYATYVNGVQDISYNRANTYNVPNMSIGSWQGASGFLPAYIDDFMFDKSLDLFGISSYPFPATITVPTESLITTEKKTSTTELMMALDTQDVSGDGGGNNYHIPQFIGNAQLDTDIVDPWGTYNGVFKFDGSGDYITIPDSPNWNIHKTTTTDVTIDFRVKHTSAGNYEVYVTQFQNADNRWLLYKTSSNLLAWVLRQGGTNQTIGLSTSNIADGQWHHIAFIKTGSYYGVYFDGKQESYAVNTTNFDISGLLYLGQQGDSTLYFNGSLSEIRIQHENSFDASPVVGLTDTIKVPTEPYNTDAGLILPNQSIIIM